MSKMDINIVQSSQSSMLLQNIHSTGNRGSDLTSLSKLIDRYWSIIDNRKKKNRKSGSVDNFLATTVSFDELYETKFKQDLLNNHQESKRDRVTQLIEMAGLTQEQLNEIL